MEVIEAKMDSYRVVIDQHRIELASLQPHMGLLEGDCLSTAKSIIKIMLTGISNFDKRDIYIKDLKKKAKKGFVKVKSGEKHNALDMASKIIVKARLIFIQVQFGGFGLLNATEGAKEFQMKWKEINSL